MNVITSRSLKRVLQSDRWSAIIVVGLIVLTTGCGSEDQYREPGEGTGGTPDSGGTERCDPSGISLTSPVALASDGETIFVADEGTGDADGQIVRIGEGCVDAMVIAGGLRKPSALALGGDTLYWLDAGGLYAVGVTGGAVTTLDTFQMEPSYHALHADESYLYVTTGDALERLALTGGELEHLANYSCGVTGLASDSEYVYVTQGACAGDIYRVSKADGTSELVINHQYSGDIAAGDGIVVWTRYEGGSVSIKRPGRDADVPNVAANSDGPLEIDDHYVYFASKIDGFSAVPLAGGAATPIEYCYPVDVALTDHYIHWIDDDELHYRPLLEAPLDTGFPSGSGAIHITWEYPPNGCDEEGVSIMLGGPTKRNGATLCHSYEHTFSDLAPGIYQITMDLKQGGFTTRFVSFALDVSDGVVEIGPIDMSPLE